MFKRILFMGRKNDKNSKKVLSFIKKKARIVNVIWSMRPDEKINSKFFLKQNYDYIFCFRSFYILTDSMIKKTRYAAINFHPGPPEYRGAGCVNYAVYNNEKKYGCTAHIINQKIDNGKILDVKRFKINKKDSIEKILEKTYLLMVLQAKKIINYLNKNQKYLKKMELNSKKEKWSKKISKFKDLDKFYEINKNISKKELIIKIRATKTKNFKPFVLLHSKKFKLVD